MRAPVLCLITLLLAAGCGSDGAQACLDDSECGDTTTCIDGFCRLPGACDGDEDCSLNQVCGDTGLCEENVCDSMSCPEDFFCSTGGVCLADGECGGDDDCPDGFCSGSGLCLTDGQCNTKEDCLTGVQVCSDDGMCVAGMGCGAQEFAASGASDLLIVLDNSCSMTKNAAPGVPKWDAAVAATNTVLAAHGTSIRFGLELFPDKITDGSSSCTQDDLQFPIGSTTVDMTDFLTATLDPTHEYAAKFGPCKTPIAPALGGKELGEGDTTHVEGVTLDPAIANPDPARNVGLLFITDGKQTCGGDRGKIVDTIGYHLGRSIKTYVVGFGDGVNSSNLDDFAVAGGTARAVPDGEPKYYQANTPQELDEAFADIAGAIGCSIVADFGDTPPAKDELYVFFNDFHLVAPDQWTYEPGTGLITFLPSSDACERLQISDPADSRRVQDIDVVIGCRGPVVD